VARELGESGVAVEIVNADAMQLYRGMDIGTAKVPESQRGGIPHHVFDIWEVTREASVADYQSIARAAIQDVQSRGAVPLLVGGSGLYVSAVLYEFEFPGTDPAVRARLEERLEQDGIEVLLADLATKDGLTGLKTHKAFQEHLVKQFGRAKEHGSPLSVVLLDVDQFKQFNDSFGHPAGDVVLKRVAMLLEREARGTDLIARYGGEEFVVVLDRTDEEGALRIAERFRKAIEGEDWEHRKVTASFGVASLDETADTKQDMVDRADAALYASKRNGRNRVTHWAAIRQDQAA
jgi:diguanylate cyclase (GGDEF)-like protein